MELDIDRGLRYLRERDGVIQVAECKNDRIIGGYMITQAKWPIRSEGDMEWHILHKRNVDAWCAAATWVDICPVNEAIKCKYCAGFCLQDCFYYA